MLSCKCGDQGVLCCGSRTLVRVEEGSESVVRTVKCMEACGLGLWQEEDWDLDSLSLLYGPARKK